MKKGNRSSRVVLLGVAVAVCFVFGSPVLPQENKPPQEEEKKKEEKKKPIALEEITVTASRVEGEIKNVPLSITVITPEKIERRQARAPNQMLREEAGIWSVQVAAQGSPIVRGQIGNRVLYLWDGIRINNGALFAGPNPFFNQFPIGAIDRMEVIRGPGSVQYGSDAMGGVINIISKQNKLFSDGLEYGGDVYTRYGSVDNEFTNIGDFRLSTKQVNFIGGITKQDIDDYKGPNAGHIKNTGFEALGGYAKLAYKPATNHLLQLSYIDGRRDNIDTYTQSKMNATAGPRIFAPFEERGLTRIDYKIDDLASWTKELKSYIYYQKYGSARNFTTETGTQIKTTRTDANQEIFGLGVQNVTQLTIVSKDDRLIYGVDYRKDNLRSAKTLFTTTKSTGDTTKTLPSGNVPDGSYDVSDIFLLTETKPLERMTYSLGGRFESIHIDSSPTQSDTLAPFTVDDLTMDKRWTSFTWSTGAVYWFTDEISLAGNIATGFRAPTYSDALSISVPVFASGIAFVPSKDVTPEKSITYELGPRYVSDRWNAFITGYLTQLSDTLVSVDAGTIVIPGVGTVVAKKRTNSGEGRIYGVETGAAYRITDEWTIFGNLTSTVGRDTKNNDPLRFIPPLNGLLGARWESQPKKWWGETTLVLVNRFTHQAPDDQMDAGFSKDPGYGSPNSTNNPPYRAGYEIPGYYVLNLRGGVEVWKQDNRSFNLTLDINNVTNQQYREVYSQQQLVAPALGFVVGAELKF